MGRSWCDLEGLDVMLGDLQFSMLHMPLTIIMFFFALSLMSKTFHQYPRTCTDASDHENGTFTQRLKKKDT